MVECPCDDAMKYKLDCPFYSSVSVVHEKWVLSILQDLKSGSKRFNEISRDLKITPKILAKKLKMLEDENIVFKKGVLDKKLLKFYSLTEKGNDLYEALDSMRLWSIKWSEKDGTPCSPIKRKLLSASLLQ